MRSNNEIIKDANYLLRGWSDELKAEIWTSFKLAIDQHREIHGKRPNTDAADWMTVLAGCEPFTSLLERIAVIELGLGRRTRDPLARLVSVIALLAVERGDKKLVGKLDCFIQPTAKQSRIRIGRDGTDKLTMLIRGYLKVYPEASNRATWDYIIEISKSSTWFDEPDAGREGLEVWYQPTPKADMRMCNRAKLSKRMHKLRNRLGLESITGRRSRRKVPGEAEVSPKAKEPHSYPKWLVLVA